MTPGAWLTGAFAWQAMMTAMMAPVAYPWLRAVQALAPAANHRPVATFGAGYFTAWLPFSASLAVVQLEFTHVIGGSIFWRGGLLLAAGLYQFAPLKRACLRHCRNPMSGLLARWKGEAVSAFRLGLQHGVVCLGCCWALMATALAVGMMNLAWMAALATATFAEQVLPRAGWVRPALGWGLMAAGGVALIR